ncbi:MAG: hypothetical protein JNM19_14945 [Chitinophagaceae bacterium]|nr:hypothetical protein [Chitinophagaceae bacterium]
MKKEYWINVKHVDNRLVIFLNGETVWDSGIVHDDPELDKYIEITPMLQEHANHTNELIFEGFNDTFKSSDSEGEMNPWHFHYRLFTRTVDETGKIVAETDIMVPYNEKHLSNPNIRAINNCYHLVKNGSDFKIVSNMLSQQFYK